MDCACAHPQGALLHAHGRSPRPLGGSTCLGAGGGAARYHGKLGKLRRRVLTSNSGEQNFYYQFDGPAGRKGYLIADPQFVALLKSRSDPRLTNYFESKPVPTFLSPAREAPDFQQPFVTYDENTLIWAEASYRTGNQVVASRS